MWEYQGKIEFRGTGTHMSGGWWRFTYLQIAGKRIKRVCVHEIHVDMLDQDMGRGDEVHVWGKSILAFMKHVFAVEVNGHTEPLRFLSFMRFLISMPLLYALPIAFVSFVAATAFGSKQGPNVEVAFLVGAPLVIWALYDYLGMIYSYAKLRVR